MSGRTKAKPRAAARNESAARLSLRAVGAAWVVAALWCAGALFTASPASAASGVWWNLTAASRPANIDPGSASDAVEEIIVTPQGGEAAFELAAAERLGHSVEELGTFATEPFAAEDGLPEPTVANLRTAFEGAYGIGAVSVSEEPPSSLHFKVTFPDQTVPKILATSAGVGTAEARLVSQGHPDGELVLTAENAGSADADGSISPIEIADTLPAGVHAVSISAWKPGAHALANDHRRLPCSLATLTCTDSGVLAPYEAIELRIGVTASLPAGAEPLNRVHIGGGGTPAGALERPIRLSSEVTPFGIAEYSLTPESLGGAGASQAASHPFQLTTDVVANQGPEEAAMNSPYKVEDAALPKDTRFIWPAGLLGNPNAVEQCSLKNFLQLSAVLQESDLCTAASAVGIATVQLYEPQVTGPVAFTVPLFSLEPAFGEPARFGFVIPIAETFISIDTALRSNGDYGVTVSSNNISQTANLLAVDVTVWGTPASSSHDNTRGWGCLYKSREAEFAHETCVPSPVANPRPFLTLPTSCPGTPLQNSVEADSWSQPGALGIFPGIPAAAIENCNAVPFGPAIHSEPTSNAATSPTGLNFDLDVHDEGLENPEGLAQSQIKKAVVTLPEGFTTNPSVAEGLKACSEQAYQSSTTQPGTGCPEESKIGEVEVESPLVNQKVTGSLFVAEQTHNPNHNLLTIYMVLQNAELGVLIKAAGKVEPNPITGQLTTTFDNLPQLPISHFRLSFRQGQRSPLVTPPNCGAYTVAADLYPYSEPNTPLHRTSSFQITQGPEGNPCPSGATPPFHPVLEAGSLNNAAGTYSPFTTRITRRDSEQEITHFSIKLPPGVSGKLAGIPECSDAAIAAAKAREHEGGGTEELNSPSCPLASEVGHSLVGSGVGNVLAYAPGRLYLAGPYHGSNLSLVSITAAKVGPFDLGTVVVRFALKIDPETAEVSVDGATSDPIPHIVDGIPVHLRDIRAYVDRPDFVLNPTSCKKTSTASTVLGSGLNFASEADDVPVTVTSPFQAADCASLGFAPQVALSLKGGTKRGATPAFKAVLTFPKGNYANIASSQVTLPHSEFLEQAHIGTVCTRAQFKEGKVPGEKCPAASVYGRARAVTPILSEPLEGPVYLRSSSHQLPDLVATLHNAQVDIALDGRIDSVENGRIRNTFEAVPDAPVTKFVLEMQGGKKGLLVNSTDICKARHTAISHFVGQNGKVYDTNPALKAPCGGKAKKKGKGKKGSRHS